MKELREDLRLAPIFVLSGWSIDFNVLDKQYNRIDIAGPNYPQAGLVFKKTDKVIWHCISGWACAEFDGNTYKNHRYYNDLQTVFNKEN